MSHPEVGSAAVPSALEAILEEHNVNQDDSGAIAQAATLVNLPKGAVVFEPGAKCEQFLLVLGGVVRVQLASETGREIVLYRVVSGESCMLTTACLLGNSDYTAEAIVEQDVQAAALPNSVFSELIGSSPDFRRFVFAPFGARLSNLMALINEIAFHRIDARLAEILLDRSTADGIVDMTHQNLAVELGTAREVVSRQLKEFERRSFILLHRGRIEVRQPAALKKLIEASRM